jgi:O-antigen/teichoic acid export membrane protein
LLKFAATSTQGKRLIVNAIGYGYGQLITVAVQLGLVPFFLRYWGTEPYADWLVLTSVPLTLTLLDLGVSQALASAATVSAGAGCLVDVRRCIQTALAFTLALCATLLLLATFAVPAISWKSLLQLESMTGDAAEQVVLLMTAYLCIGLLGGPLDAWFRAIDRTAEGAFALANRRAIDLLLSIAVLASGGGAVALAKTLLCGQVVSVTALYVLACHWSPIRILGLRYASLPLFRATFRPAVAYAGFPLAQVATLQGGLQLLNQAASPAVVVAFAMTRSLTRLVMQVGVVLSNASKPEISRLIGQQRPAEAHRLVSRTAKTAKIISTAFFGLIIIIGPFIADVWSGGKVEIASHEFALVGAHAIANVYWFVAAAALMARNAHAPVSTAYGVASVVALAMWASLLSDIPPILGASIVLLLPELAAIGVTRRTASLPQRDLVRL